MNIRFPLALLLALLFTAACGQSGPLYLPGDPSKIKTDAPRQDERETEEVDNEEDEEESQNDD